MNCPVCKNAMITFELSDVEVDKCLDCKGIWLDAGELEMLLGGGDEAEKLLASFKKAANCGEKPRKCPICLKKMEKVFAGHEKHLIDRCKRGDGIWFDENELSDVLSIGESEQGKKVCALLADMFSGQHSCEEKD
jgi:hypothetical protein